MEVKAKGIEYPITVSEVLEIGRPHQLFLPEASDELVSLGEGIPIIYTVVESTVPGEDGSRGTLTKLSRKAAEARLEKPMDIFSNLEIRIDENDGEKISGIAYGKIMGPVPGTRTEFSICFTSVSPEIVSLFRSLLSQSPGIVAEPRDLTRRKRSRAAG